MKSSNISEAQKAGSEGSSLKSICSICWEKSDGQHFGTEACRACAAFFRRSVSLEKKYVCQGVGLCEMKANIRCACRACRFKKCLEAGMNPICVQTKRDILGKRGKQFDHNIKSQVNNVLVNMDSTTHKASNKHAEKMFDVIPLLERLRKNYSKMDNMRLIVHREDDVNIHGQRMPRSINYKEAREMLNREISLVCDWVCWCFDDFCSLDNAQKKCLLQNFFISFTLLESAYLCHINGRSDVVILPSGDYIDIDHAEQFYAGIQMEQSSMSANEVVKILKPSLELYRHCLVRPIMHERIDVYEFFALCSLVLWDFGVEGQSEECNVVSRNIREKIIKEISSYYTIINEHSDPTLRMAQIMCILPSLQRVARKFNEDAGITVFTDDAKPINNNRVYPGKEAKVIPPEQIVVTSQRFEPFKIPSGPVLIMKNRPNVKEPTGIRNTLYAQKFHPIHAREKTTIPREVPNVQEPEMTALEMHNWIQSLNHPTAPKQRKEVLYVERFKAQFVRTYYTDGDVEEKMLVNFGDPQTYRKSFKYQ
ncbi:unnamed protein product [Caenorhabditis bovis]|uniref:Nuclear receptor domain-containing protein n=1 Tax=Caenorhabditis bovis TaxID=2654633 RepID=A0A8S1E484_9PELO|nr:unnamed protein product [Caenorhabditis bovis]